GGQPMETGHRHVIPVPLMYLPDDPRTKLKRRRLCKKAVRSRCSQGTESITALPASSHPVPRKLTAISVLAKRFFALRHQGFPRLKASARLCPPRSSAFPAATKPSPEKIAVTARGWSYPTSTATIPPGSR